MKSLTKYFSINIISLLGNLSFLIFIFYFFVIYPLAMNQSETYDSFDIIYGIFSEFYRIYLFILKFYILSFILLIIEFFVKKIVSYPSFKFTNNKFYLFLFYAGFLLVLLQILLIIFNFYESI